MGIQTPFHATKKDIKIVMHFADSKDMVLIPFCIRNNYVNKFTGSLYFDLRSLKRLLYIKV